MNSTKYVFRSVVVLYAFLITFSINSPTLLGQSCNAYEVVADINVKTIDIDPYPRYLIDLSLTLSRSITLFKRIDFNVHYPNNDKIRKVEIDFGKGNFQEFDHNFVQSEYYNNYGTYTIKVKVTYIDPDDALRDIEKIASIILKVQQGNEQIGFEEPHMIIPLESKVAFVPPVNDYYPPGHEDGKTKKGYASAYIRFADKVAQYDIPMSQGKKPYLCSPIIFVEGLDFGTETTCDPDNDLPLQHGLFGWPQFTLGTSADAAIPGEGGFDQLKLMPHQIKKFIDDGHDVILIDFKDGADWIQKNSELLQILIEKVNEMKMGCSHSKPTMVMGASMGGLISRHAITSMEKNNQCHDASIYISFDAPHLGANIPIALQAAAWFSSLFGNPETWDKLHRPAPRQLLFHTLETDLSEGKLVMHNWGHSDISLNVTNCQSIRDQFAAEMTALDFPKQCRNLAISDGSEIATNQGYDHGSRYIRDELQADAFGFYGPVMHFQLAAAKGEGPYYARYDYKCNTIGSSYYDRTFDFSIFTGFGPYDFNTVIGDKETPCKYHAFTFTGTDNTYLADAAPGGMRLGDFGDVHNSVLDLYNAEKSKHYKDVECTQGYNQNNDQTCFIPTMSALAIGWQMNNVNLNRNIQNELIITPELIPFDAYYAPNNQRDNGNNLQHVELTQGMIDWIGDQLEIPFQSDYDEIPNSYGAKYNFGLNNNLFEFTDIMAGGTVSVNDCGNTGYGNEGLTQKNVFEVSTSCRAYINVLESGTIQLGNESCEHNGMLNILGESTLHIHRGGTLRIFGSLSKLYIAPNAKLILEEGAIIEMHDSQNRDGESKIIIAGTLIWRGDIEFKGNGHFRFESTNSISILNDMKLSAELEGVRFIQLAMGATMRTGKHFLELSNGKIVYENLSKITNEFDCNFTNLDLTGSHLIETSNATALEMEDFNSMYITDCSVNHLKYGFMANGKNANEFIYIQNSNINTEFGLKATNTERVNISNTIFTPITVENNAISCENNSILDFNNVSATGYALSQVLEPKFAAIRFVNSGLATLTSCNISANFYGIYCPEFNVNGDLSSTNIRMKYCTVNNNYYGITMYGFASTSGGKKKGLLDIACSSVCYNSKAGVTGNDIDLFIDNRSGVNRQNSFIPFKSINGNGTYAYSPVFKIDYISRLINTIYARKNFWGGGNPEFNKHYQFNYPINFIYQNVGTLQSECGFPGDIVVITPISEDDQCEILDVMNPDRNLESEFYNAYSLLEQESFEEGMNSMGIIASTINTDVSDEFTGICQEMIEYTEHFGLRPPSPRNSKSRNSEIRVVPNPFNNELKILTSESDLTVKVFNSVGQELINEHLFKSGKISTNHLPSGLYYYSVIGLDGIVVQSGKLEKIK